MNKKEEQVTDYRSVVKNNNLIRGRYSLEASEQKLLYRLFEYVQKHKYTTREITLKFDEFYRSQKEVTGKNFTKKDFKNLIEGVQDKMPYIIIGDEFIRTTWYKIKGKINLDEVTLILDDDVFQYIKAQDKNFTMLRLESLYSFKSFNSMRIYELIKQWCNTKTKILFPLDELKKHLNLDVREVKGKEINTGYKKYTNFNTKVLKPAVAEINKKSEIRISYKSIKEKNKIIAVEFTILEQQKYYGEEFEKVVEKEEVKDVPAKKKQPSVILPDDSMLSAGARRMMGVDFKGMDFTEEELYMAYVEAEALTMDKDGTEDIQLSSYKYFKTILKDKIEELNKTEESNEDNPVVDEDEEFLRSITKGYR